jgi:hypothetical protein
LSLNKTYFEYTIRDTTIQSVEDLLSVQSGSFISNFKSIEEFLNYDGGQQGNFVAVGTGITNLQRIKSRYTDDEINSLSIQPTNRSLLIKFGTTVLIPFTAIDRDIISLFGDVKVSVDSNAFISRALRLFYTNPKNVRSILTGKETNKLGNYKEMFNHISVWLWSKSLSSFVSGGEIKNADTIINIAPYIGNLSTTVNKNGGSFSFTLDPILGKFNEATNKWEINSDTVRELKNSEYISQERISNDDQKRASYYFHNIIQENDLVFIRFETLESEEDRLTNKHSFEVDKSELQFKNFDMIGLIDAQSISSNFASNDVTINVKGRDLMKLFIEDGVYFYPFDFIEGGIFANANKDQDDRLTRYDGQLLSRFQIGYKRIENVLAFIINALGTIKICSDDLFSYYKNQGSENKVGVLPDELVDRRTHKYKLSNEEQKKIVDNNDTTEKERYNNDIVRIKDCRKDSGLTQKVMSDDEGLNNIDKANNEENNIVKNVYNLIRYFLSVADFAGKLTKDTWKASFEFNGKTIAKDGEFPDDFYNFLYVDNNPINKGKKPTPAAISCLQSMITNYLAQKERDRYVPTQFESVPLKGIWQIIKLVVDKSVQGRLLADSSIGNEHGSLINAIRKVCQEPFVEFYGDTIGDQYYLTVRKPPFDQQGFIGMLDGNTIDETGNLQHGTSEDNLVGVNIKDEDILDENLQCGAEAFSWYHLNPMANLAGGADMAFAFLRAVFFKEYADFFGSRPLDLSTNYIPFIPFENGDNQKSNAYMIKQGIEDLSYMIQSNAYLPFVRRGTITIAGGNRRIKRGCLIRLVATGEVGFVESVTHNVSFNLNNVDRTTTITVDRLMVERYIKGVSVDIGTKQVNVSYFNLINTDIDKSLFTGSLTIEKGIDITSNWKVNPEVFNFFVTAQQFK